MDKINLKAYGKINLSLDIVGKKENGYHLVDMTMHSVGIFDFITIEKIKEKRILIECDKTYIPTDERNIIYKAANKFFEYTNVLAGVKIILKKTIPTQAGMGGGSADAAGTLLGLNKLFETNLSLGVLKTIGLTLGADVPFCIEGGCARAEGIGEVLTKLNPITAMILVIKPKYGVSTVEAYKAVNINQLKDRPNNEKLIKAINSNDINSVPKFMGNVLYEISSKFVPEIKYVVETMSQQIGCKKSMMSGSGSTVFGIFEDKKTMIEAAKLFEGMGFDMFYTYTMNNGVSFV